MPNPTSRRVPAAPPSRAGELAGLLLELAGDVVVLVQLAQALVLLHELGHVARVLRHVVGELVGLGDHRRHDQRDQQQRDGEQAEVDDRDREAAPHAPASTFTGRRQRDREERGDQQPADRLAQQVEQVERDRHADDGQHDADDLPREAPSGRYSPPRGSLLPQKLLWQAARAQQPGAGVHRQDRADLADDRRLVPEHLAAALHQRRRPGRAPRCAGRTRRRRRSRGAAGRSRPSARRRARWCARARQGSSRSPRSGSA